MFLIGRKWCVCALGLLTCVAGCGGPKAPKVMLENDRHPGPTAKQLAEQLGVEMALFKVDVAAPTTLWLSYDLWSHATQVKKNELITALRLEPGDKQVTVMWNETAEGLNFRAYSDHNRSEIGLAAYKARPPHFCYGVSRYHSLLLKPDCRVAAVSSCYGRPYVSMGTEDKNVKFDAKTAANNDQSFTLYVTVGNKGDIADPVFTPWKPSSRNEGGPESLTPVR